MGLTNPQEIEAKVEARFRVFLILWAAILMSVGLLSAIGFILPSKGTPNPTLSYALAGLGLMMFGVSFLLKPNLVQRAIDKNDIAGLQSAHLVGLALCEIPALCGLVNHLATGSRISMILFAISAVGILLNFPSKDQIRSVSYEL